METERMNGGEFRVARTVLGLSQSGLARRLGVRRDTLARWESGREPVPYAVPNELGEVANARVREINRHFKRAAEAS